MTDLAPKPTQPLSHRSAALHTILGLAALVALFASRLPRFAQYGDLVTTACGMLGLGSVVAAKAYLPPRVRALIEFLSPTPPAASKAVTQ